MFSATHQSTVIPELSLLEFLPISKLIMKSNDIFEFGLTRRDFVKKTAQGIAGIGAGLLASTNYAYAGGSDRVRIGLIGCGGRGTGAANNALKADSSVEIYSMGDLFRDRLQASREALIRQEGDRVNVPEGRCFDGFDNFTGVMESGVHAVILATPPGFRPQHIRAAVERDLHIFMEKPIAVDSAGVRAVIESGEEGRRKNLSMVAGTQYRRQPSFVEAIQLIHDGAIGELLAAQEYYMTGPVWLRERKAEMTELEWQCLNWYYYTWLSGDHIVEQFVHNIDAIDWAFQTHPVRAIGSGGRQVRVDPEYGHIYDHFSVEYHYPNGARVLAMSRQMAGTASRVANRIVGTRGFADINPANSLVSSHEGEVLLRHNTAGNNPYVQTHVDLIASIRDGKPLNETRSVAESTLTAILGREAAYTGQDLAWEDVFNAEMKLGPETFDRGEMPAFEVAKPGKTELERSFPARAG